MGFRKPLYDVEEKGLNPEVPHTSLGSDGRLLPAKDNLGTPTAVSSSTEKTNLDEIIEEKAVPKTSEGAANTPQSANKKATTKKAVDKSQDVKQELPDNPTAEKESSTKKKVTRTRKTPTAKADKTTARKSTTSSKSKTSPKKTSG